MNEYLLGGDENLTRDGNDVSPKTGRRQDLRKGESKAIWSRPRRRRRQNVG